MINRIEVPPGFTFLPAQQDAFEHQGNAAGDTVTLTRKQADNVLEALRNHGIEKMFGTRVENWEVVSRRAIVDMMEALGCPNMELVRKEFLLEED